MGNIILHMKNYISSIGYFMTFILFLYLLNPFDKSILFGFVLVPLFLARKHFIKLHIDFNFFLLLITSIIYALFSAFDPVVGMQYVFAYAIFPPMFYLIGKHLINPNVNEQNIVHILVIIGVLFSFSAMVSVMLNILEGGFAQYERTLPYFLSGNPVSATKMGAYFTFNMCIPAILIADSGKSKLIFRLFVAGIFIVSLLCVIRLGSRTQLSIMLITSLIALFYVMPRQHFSKNFRLMILLALLILLVLKNVSFDLKADWLSTFAGRMENGSQDIASGGGRTERWSKSFEYMFKSPLGWSVKEFGYSHNLWLDALRVSGVITFILLSIFSIRALVIIHSAIKSNKISLLFNLQILVYTVGFFLLFMVEPIFEALFSFYCLFCIFVGALYHYSLKKFANSVINN